MIAALLPIRLKWQTSVAPAATIVSDDNQTKSSICEQITMARTDQILVSWESVSSLLNMPDATKAEIAAALGLKPGVLDKVQAGKSVNVQTATTIAQSLGGGIDVLDIGEYLTLLVDSPILYQRAFGLSIHKRKITLSDRLYQDFDLYRSPPQPTFPPNHPLDFLWADVVGAGRITAQLQAEGPAYFLHLEFSSTYLKGQPEPYPSNVAIHPQWMMAIDVDLQSFKWLTIPIRLPEVTPPHADEFPIQISVRIRDSKLQQWVFGSMNGTEVTLDNLPVLTGGWRLVTIPLHSTQWNPFSTATSHSGARRDFSTITSITIEVGRSNYKRRPSFGSGVIDVGPISFEPTSTNRTTLAISASSATNQV